MRAVTQYRGAPQLAIAKSQRIRPLALEAAKHGLGRDEIAQSAGVSRWLASEVLKQYRKSVYPVLEGHSFTRGNQTFYDVDALSKMNALSGTGLRAIIVRAGIPPTLALSPRSHSLIKCYDAAQVRLAVENANGRQRRVKRYREIQREFGVSKYLDLTDSEMATLLILIDFMSRYGQSPTLGEINEALGYVPSYATLVLPRLILKGYISRDLVHGLKRGLPVYRYLIHKGPAKMVTIPIRCPECGNSMRINQPWYQARSIVTNGVGK